MNLLEERINAGRALAVNGIKDAKPELGWFIAAIRARYDNETGEPTSFSIMAHWRSWFRYCTTPFGDPTVEEIADRFTDWMRNALECEMLTVEDPPLGEGIFPANSKIKDLVRMRLIELRGPDAPAVTNLADRKLAGMTSEGQADVSVHPNP